MEGFLLAFIHFGLDPKSCNLLKLEPEIRFSLLLQQQPGKMWKVFCFISGGCCSEERLPCSESYEAKIKTLGSHASTIEEKSYQPPKC